MIEDDALINMINEGGPVEIEDSGAAKVVVELKEIRAAASEYCFNTEPADTFRDEVDRFVAGAIWMKEKLSG